MLFLPDFFFHWTLVLPLRFYHLVFFGHPNTLLDHQGTAAMAHVRVHTIYTVRLGAHFCRL